MSRFAASRESRAGSDTHRTVRRASHLPRRQLLDGWQQNHFAVATRILDTPGGHRLRAKGRTLRFTGESRKAPDDALERMMVGYLDHEMVHVAFSDFKVAESVAKKHPSMEGLLDIIEDARIERDAMQRWPGVRRNLDMMFEQIKPRVAQLIQQRNPFDRFCIAVYLRLSHHNDDIVPCAKPTEVEAVSLATCGTGQSQLVLQCVSADAFRDDDMLLEKLFDFYDHEVSLTLRNTRSR